MSDDFKLPDLGEGIHEAQIIHVLVKEGDVVQADQSLMEVETDKAAVEIPSPRAGRVARLHVSVGQTVKVGSVLVTFGDEQGVGARLSPASPSGSTGAVARSSEKSTPVHGRGTDKSKEIPNKNNRGLEASGGSGPGMVVEASPGKTGVPARVAASPVVRRLAKERGVDLSTIAGTGSGGRVTQEDLDRAVGAGRGEARGSEGRVGGESTPPVSGGELPDFSKWGPVRREAIPQIRKTIAAQMVRSQTVNVHVMHHDLADIQMLEQLRKDHNARLGEGETRLTLLPFVIKAVCAAMKRYPVFNSSFDHIRNEIVYKDYFHFGIAVDTPRGLVVPVIRDVDRKSIRELAGELAKLGEKARQANFTIDELRGGTFTLTNIGSLGGIVSTPIINYPETAVLGLGKADMRAVVHEGAVVARYVLPVNLSFDHRVIDGADAARFAGEVIRYLEIPGRLLLEE